MSTLLYHVNLVNGDTRKTRRELLAAADVQMTPASDRLIDDWVAKGLLDRPRREGLGRGRGIRATWPESQLKLFLLLLRKRGEANRIATLCNVPVSLWIYFGDSYATTAQVRRALATWNARYRRGSLRSAWVSAKQVVPDPEVVGVPPWVVGNLRRAIVDTSVNGRVDSQRLEEAVATFVESSSHGAMLTPYAAQSYLTAVKARMEAAQRIDEIREELLELSRTSFRGKFARYLKDHQRLATDLEAPTVFTIPSDEELLNTACLDLLTEAGLFMLGERVLSDQGEASSNAAP